MFKNFMEFVEEIRNNQVETNYNGDIEYGFEGEHLFDISIEQIESLGLDLEDISFDVLETSEIFMEKAKAAYVAYAKTNFADEVVEIGQFWDGNFSALNSLEAGNYTDKCGINYHFSGDVDFDDVYGVSTTLVKLESFDIF